MSAHTLSPWRSALVSEKSWNRGIYESTGRLVALVKVASMREAGRRDADARLIAAAPDLLNALQVMLDAAMNDITAECDQARAAIAKATRGDT